MADRNNLPIILIFNFDNYLLYLIQQTTKKDSIDILAFFNDFSRTVAEIGLQKRTGNGIHKKITNFFPDTCIPFYIELKGRPSRNHQRKEDYKETFQCEVEVTFPKDTTKFPKDFTDKITEALMERELLGQSVELQAFDRPKVIQSNMYKKTIEDILGKQPKREIKPGYDPDITGTCRNCKSKPSSSWRPCVCDKDVKV